VLAARGALDDLGRVQREFAYASSACRHFLCPKRTTFGLREQWLHKTSIVRVQAEPGRDRVAGKYGGVAPK
jgi:hypothetical protein